MKLGYVCPGVDMLEYAVTLGYDGVELCGFEGTPLDPLTATEEAVHAAHEEMKGRKLQTLSFHYGVDYAAALGGSVQKAIDSFGRAMRFCRILDTRILSVNCWFDPSQPRKADDYVRSLYAAAGDMAMETGVRIAIENCPHSGHNFVNSPDTMGRFLELVDKECVGFEFDPSHMVWQGCDYMAALKRFRGKVFAVHAKDTEIMEDVLKAVGIRGQGWWRYRMPGWGKVDWKAFMTELFVSGYDGPVIIEHEDPVFDGARREQGLRKGREFLAALIH